MKPAGSSNKPYIAIHKKVFFPFWIALIRVFRNHCLVQVTFLELILTRICTEKTKNDSGKGTGEINRCVQFQRGFFPETNDSGFPS